MLPVVFRWRLHMKMLSSLLLSAILLLPGLALAGPDDAPDRTEASAFVASLRFKEGEISIPEADAKLRLGNAFRYLEKADARRVLESLWGNPPDDTVLGLVVPRDTPLTDDRSWAVVVTYSDDGYISDEDAAKIDYDEMLADMKAADPGINEERKKQGYEALNLVGWAEQPRYDATSKKLYWAKELHAEGVDANTLNYDIRVLGRRGYLSFNAISAMRELGAVRAGMQSLLPLVEFDQGARYADYDASTDKLADYGIAALVGGGLAAKAGLFGKLGILLLKAWKLVAVAFVGLIALIGKLFGRKKKGVVN